jgi:hypothetical protein
VVGRFTFVAFAVLTAWHCSASAETIHLFCDGWDLTLDTARKVVTDNLIREGTTYPYSDHTHHIEWQETTTFADGTKHLEYWSLNKETLALTQRRTTYYDPTYSDSMLTCQILRNQIP